MTTNPRFIHGHASRIAGFGRVVRGSPEHNAYMNIISRCGPNCAEKSKKHYFLKGVKVLFKDFAEFYNEVGERPSPEHSIDRIDGDGNYEPGNVRWATRNQQARNRSNVKLTEKDAEDIRRLLRSGISGPALARAYGVSNGTIYFIKSNKHWA